MTQALDIEPAEAATKISLPAVNVDLTARAITYERRHGYDDTRSHRLTTARITRYWQDDRWTVSVELLSRQITQDGSLGKSENGGTPSVLAPVIVELRAEYRPKARPVVTWVMED